MANTKENAILDRARKVLTPYNSKIWLAADVDVDGSPSKEYVLVDSEDIKAGQVIVLDRYTRKSPDSAWVRDGDESAPVVDIRENVVHEEVE